MSRKPAAIPGVRLTLWLPLPLRSKLDLELVSEVESRVPRGDYSKFFIARIQEHFEWETLQLKALGFPDGYFVRGPREMIQTLQEQLLTKGVKA